MMKSAHIEHFHVTKLAELILESLGTINVKWKTLSHKEPGFLRLFLSHI